MPVKRRASKRRPALHPALEAMMRGEMPEPTEDARDAILGVYFFNEGPQEPEILRRAAEVLDAWHDEGRT